MSHKLYINLLFFFFFFFRLKSIDLRFLYFDFEIRKEKNIRVEVMLQSLVIKIKSCTMRG